jgi:hypothetical protein
VQTIRNEVEHPRLFRIWPAYGVRNRVVTAFFVATVPAADLRACSQSSINAADAAAGDDERAEGSTVVGTAGAVVATGAIAPVVGAPVVGLVASVVGLVASVVGLVASVVGTAVAADGGRAVRPGRQPPATSTLMTTARPTPLPPRR